MPKLWGTTVSACAQPFADKWSERTLIKKKEKSDGGQSTARRPRSDQDLPCCCSAPPSATPHFINTNNPLANSTQRGRHVSVQIWPFIIQNHQLGVVPSKAEAQGPSSKLGANGTVNPMIPLLPGQHYLTKIALKWILPHFLLKEVSCCFYASPELHSCTLCTRKVVRVEMNQNKFSNG